MANILDYIKWRGDLSFRVSPFNEVDNLILSEIAYMNLTVAKKDEYVLPLSKVGEKYLAKIGDEQVGLLLKGDFQQLIELASKSTRFGSVIIKDYINSIDLKIESQFAAIVFELDQESAYVAFRGTDDTLVGWKEDFKMSFIDVVPAQSKALDYLENISRTFSYKNYYVGGHSKGGNLAVYAATHVDEEFKKRIINVYNNDGPGLNKQVIEKDEYKSIVSRIKTIVPQSSVIGMLLEHEEDYRVIQSSGVGPYQHDGFSWDVIGNSFLTLSNVNDESRIMDSTIRTTLNTMTLEQREVFTNAVFDILKVDKKLTLTQVHENRLKNWRVMRKNYKSLDKVTKKTVEDVLATFLNSGMSNFLHVKTPEQWQSNYSKWRRETKKFITNVNDKVDRRINNRDDGDENE